MLEHGKHKFEYFQMTAYRFVVALLFLVLYNLILGQFVAPRLNQITEFTTIAFLLYIALISGLLSLVLYYYGLKTTHASVSAIFELAFPLSALVFLPLIFKNQIVDKIQIYGALILIISTTILSYSYHQTTPLSE
jgi:drug/metabolite transporter (DMT)-like permease